MTPRMLIAVAILLHLLPCVTAEWNHEVEFEQSPAMSARPGEARELKCNHSEGSYHNMYWYRQAGHGRALVLIGSGHSKGEPTYEAQFKARFRLTREGVRTGSLHISSLTVEDTAVAGSQAFRPQRIMCHTVRPLLLLSIASMVQSSADIVQSERDVFGALGGAASVPCSVDGMGSFTMCWYRQHHWGGVVEFILDETGEVYGRSFGGRFTVTHRPSANQFTLHIEQLQLSDSAEYYCTTGHRAAQL
ncbi:hypothetical protein AAFF_G00214400 [Aldrovandia affinis]|uniref:Ig-like domain-containing protein n=1 Tax=Aldrovandia affinis TaxID=143900 RepID=A0AAD7RGV1_9TELE|nr:hypothetical protein AAFF_G00214400 [Aldrovandia affinis]